MFIKRFNKKGFTLAEVLLTLSIVGVVAAMTIPSLVSDIQDADTVSKLRKYHTSLQQAVKMYMATNGVSDLKASGLFAGYRVPTPSWTAFKPYLNLVKDCGTTTGCFPSGVMYKQLNGGNRFVIDTKTDAAKGKFADGVAFFIWDSEEDCDTDGSTSHSGQMTTVCATFLVDVNGDKGPNQYGRDTFEFGLVRDGTLYATGALDSNAKGCNPTGSTNASDGYAGVGYGCTYKVLTEGKISY